MNMVLLLIQRGLNSLFHLKVKRDPNMETIYWTQDETIFRILRMYETVSGRSHWLNAPSHAWKNAGPFRWRNRHYNFHMQTCKAHVNGARQG